MLLSEIEERSRRFKLALRAGIPILLLIGLIAYIVFLKEGTLHFSTENYFLMGAVIFISVYFIYFLLEHDAQETLLDHETHGFNLKAFERKLRSSQSKTIALLFINNLQSINENYGALATNTMLFHLIQRLNQSLQESGLEKALIGRRHGAEFLIAISGKSEDLGVSLEQFTMNNPNINSIDIDYKVSLATYNNEALEKVILHLKDRQIGMQNQTKSNSRDGSVGIQDASHITELEDEIAALIQSKKLLFHFRPLQNLKHGTTDIYKASVSLSSDTLGNIPPKTYLPIVNRLGLGRIYDFAIIEHLVALLPLLDVHISMTFNISPFSLRNRGFQSKLFALLGESNIDASRLIIELYERKTYHDLSNYFQTLNYLRTKGLRISIDNFGSSNASLEYMKHFHFDMIQFDRDYVRKLDNTLTREMFRSLIEMAKGLHIITIAKWVDKEEQAKKLKSLGIDYIQGFGIGKPLSEKELIEACN